MTDPARPLATRPGAWSNEPGLDSNQAPAAIPAVAKWIAVAPAFNLHA